MLDIYQYFSSIKKLKNLGGAFGFCLGFTLCVINSIMFDDITSTNDYPSCNMKYNLSVQSIVLS